MKTYIVKVPEMYLSHMEVDANSEEDAIAKVSNGEGTEVYLEFMHTLESPDFVAETFEHSDLDKLIFAK
jgi:hypothetical protein